MDGHTYSVDNITIFETKMFQHIRVPMMASSNTPLDPSSFPILPSNKKDRLANRIYSQGEKVVIWDGKKILCQHGKSRSLCTNCGGERPCPHGKRRIYCRLCGGTGFCYHNRQKSRCKDCGGTSICQHGRRRVVCKECGGSQICIHGSIKYDCSYCKGVKKLINLSFNYKNL